MKKYWIVAVLVVFCVMWQSYLSDANLQTVLNTMGQTATPWRRPIRVPQVVHDMRQAQLVALKDDLHEMQADLRFINDCTYPGWWMTDPLGENGQTYVPKADIITELETRITEKQAHITALEQ